MIRSQLISTLLAVALWVPVTGFSGTITTPQIITQTTRAALSCMQWRPIGACFWLHCSWTGCSVRTSIKVGHYNPDLVVSTYNELGGNPWVEIRATLGLAQKAATTGQLGSLLPVPLGSSGNRTEGSSERDHKNLVYRETDAIGHPLSSLSGIVSVAGLLCPSETTSPRSLFPVRPRCPVMATGSTRDFLSGQLHSRPAGVGYLAPANLGWCLSAYRVDHAIRRTQGCGHQRAKGR